MCLQKKAPAAKTPLGERDANNNSPKQTPDSGLQRSTSNSSLQRSRSICSPVDEVEEPPESPSSPSEEVKAPPPKKSPAKHSPKKSPKAKSSSPKNVSPAVLPVGTPGKRRAQNPIIARKASLIQASATATDEQQSITAEARLAEFNARLSQWEKPKDEPQQLPKKSPKKTHNMSAKKSPKHKDKVHHEHAEVERNYVGNEDVLQKLRESDFESKAHHDCNELRAEVRHDYNESHMADAASHTHLSVEHKHLESGDAKPVDVDVTDVEVEVDDDTSEPEKLAEADTKCEVETEGQEEHVQQEEEQIEQEDQLCELEEKEQEQELEDFNKLRVVDLRERLAELELPTDGRKADLIQRLEEHYANQGPNALENCEAAAKEATADTQPEATPEQPVRAKRERKQVTRLEAGPATAKWSEYATEAETGDTAVEDEHETAEDLSRLTVAVLKKRLVELGLPTGGKKAVLVERLQDALIKGVEQVEQAEDEAEAEDEEEEVEYLTKDTIKTWTVAELKAELAARELPTTGVKATLIKRLAKEL